DAVLVATDHGLVHLLAVDGDDQRVLEFDVVHPGMEDEIAHADGVFTIDREFVLDEHAAAGAERQTFDVELLRTATFGADGQRLRCHVLGATEYRGGVAHDAFTDHACGGNVLFDEDGRNRQRFGDVVEAVGGRVFRQDAGRIHFD